MAINICRVVDPDIIIFGGGLSKAGNVLLDLIRKYVREKTWKLTNDVILKLATSDKGGVCGAALAAKHKFQSGFSKANLTNSVDLKSKTPSSNQSLWVGGAIVLTSFLIWGVSNKSRSSYFSDLLIAAQIGVGVKLLLSSKA
jgi:hypothetical protein